MTEDVLLLWTSVTGDAIKTWLAGTHAFQDQAAKMLQTTSLASSRMTASINSKKNQLLLPSLTPNSASRRNAPTNGLPAKKTPNAFPLFRTAKRNVEQRHPVGLSASPLRAAKPQSMLQNVLTAITASVSFQDLRHVFINHAKSITTLASLTKLADTRWLNAELLRDFTTSTWNAYLLRLRKTDSWANGSPALASTSAFDHHPTIT